MAWPKGRPQPPMSEETRRKISEAKKGAGNPAWKGGRTITANGYVLVHAPDHPHTHDRSNYVLEHRLVMERHLGRTLRDDEIVHHLNGDKADNRPKNLAVMTQAEHLRLHAPEQLMTEDTWKKISESRKKRWQVSGHPSTGRKHSLETREKMRQKALGRRFSNATRAKMSVAQKARRRLPQPSPSLTS